MFNRELRPANEPCVTVTFTARHARALIRAVEWQLDLLSEHVPAAEAPRAVEQAASKLRKALVNVGESPL